MITQKQFLILVAVVVLSLVTFFSTSSSPNYEELSDSSHHHDASHETRSRIITHNPRITSIISIPTKNKDIATILVTSNANNNNNKDGVIKVVGNRR